MWDEKMISMLLEGIRDTCYMTLASTVFGYVIGLPLGIFLTLTDKGGLTPNRAVYRVLDVIINFTRSVPFLILLIVVMPLIKLIVGKSYGSSATVVPLTIAAAPFIGRMVESSLKEVNAGVIEVAVSMGAKTRTIVWKVLIDGEPIRRNAKNCVAIVRALIMHPKILLLDEITAALDPEMVHEVLEVVVSLARTGSTMMIVTHEMAFAKAIATRVLFLENGEIVEKSSSRRCFLSLRRQNGQDSF